MNVLNKIFTEQKLILETDFVICSFGGGTNSTALLIECVNRGIKIDLILFADTGGERPFTYHHVYWMSQWLITKGYPSIITVKAPNVTLEQDCLNRNALPSVAYGFKTCSQRFKIQPQDKAINQNPHARQALKDGHRLVKLIGFDADEPYRANKEYNDKFTRIYPLIEWDMGRAECIQSIKNEGLVLPGKSSCFFCPNSKPSEIKWLEQTHPDLMHRALTMEQQADLKEIKGLGRNFSWKSIYQQQDAFMDHFVPDMPCECYDGGAA